MSSDKYIHTEVEDSIYAYTMILCNLFFTELFVKKFHKTNEI